MSVAPASPVYGLLRPLLFALDPELAHDAGLGLLAAASALPAVTALVRARHAVEDPRLRTRVFGLDFPNPIGLAAGFDKDARAVPALAALGFGFVEVGTVTPRPQPGNPRPRIFRLAEDGALVNRLGFNSQGADAVAARLQALRARGDAKCVVGVNLGKNRDTPNEAAARDYALALRALGDGGDYLVVNVSSPNTPGLRDLQAPALLRDVLGSVLEVERGLASARGRAMRSVLVKLSPDLADADLDATIDTAADAGAAGFVATNTTLSRPPHVRSPRASEAGGLSGAPLLPRALAVVERIQRRMDGRLPVVGVGGVGSAEDARRMLDAGAALVQLYTAFVYGGPALPRALLRGLLRDT